MQLRRELTEFISNTAVTIYGIAVAAIKIDLHDNEQKALEFWIPAPCLSAKTDFYLSAKAWLGVCLRPGAVGGFGQKRSPNAKLAK